MKLFFENEENSRLHYEFKRLFCQLPEASIIIEENTFKLSLINEKF